MADERVLELIHENVTTLIENVNLFGGYYTVEAQVLRLLEVREAMLHPERAKEAAGALLERFVSELDWTYPGNAGIPLYVRVGYNKKKWAQFLQGFVARLKIDTVWPPRPVEVQSGLRSIGSV